LPSEDYSDLSQFSPGQLVWHYTGFAGLVGILDGIIWASSAAYLNDLQEVRLTVATTLEILADQHPDVAPEDAELHRNMADLFRDMDGKQIFVTSFSQKADDLSQWRAYGGKGTAFAVGFDPRKLAAQGKLSRFELVKVAYGREAFEDEIRYSIERFHVERPPGPTKDKNAEALRHLTFAILLRDHVVPLATQCKDVSFREEEEWRLVREVPALPPDMGMKFRESGSLVIPYLEIPIHTAPPAERPPPNVGLHPPIDSPIAAIQIGPSPHPEALEHALNEMVLRKGLKASVRISEIPLRNW
jgi:hypothetical protein